MPKNPSRKYQVIEEAEIDLVLQCSDSHEFYERYLQVFPNTQKGLDSISRIWKRRSEFAKKRQPVSVPEKAGSAAEAVGVSPDLAAMIAAQNAVLAEIAALMKEQVNLSREILAELGEIEIRPEMRKHRILRELKAAEAKTPEKKPAPKKPSGPILVGS